MSYGIYSISIKRKSLTIDHEIFHVHFFVLNATVFKPSSFERMTKVLKQIIVFSLRINNSLGASPQTPVVPLRGRFAAPSPSAKQN
jgi:hypothetical protein